MHASLQRIVSRPERMSLARYATLGSTWKLAVSKPRQWKLSWQASMMSRAWTASSSKGSVKPTRTLTPKRIATLSQGKQSGSLASSIG